MSFERLNKLHKKLSHRIKTYESSLNIAPPPEVLNEIRYSYRAMLEARELELNSPDEQDKIDLAYRKAIHALYCAYHDLIDGIAIDLALAVQKLDEDYFEEFIKVCDQRRHSIIELLNEVTAIMATSRQEHEKREELYEKELYDGYFENLLAERKYILQTASEDIVKLHLINQEKSKKAKLHRNAGYLVGVVGLLIGIASLL